MEKKKRYRILFMGTPDFAVPTFLKLLKSKKFNLVGVVTQPDKKVGRKQEMVYSPVKQLALKHKIKIYQPFNLKNNDFIKEIKSLQPDIILVVAYGKIIPPSILKIPKFNCINVHPSLLPKYRGPSPMQATILNGERKTGTTIMLMNEKMDAGDILFQKEVSIDEKINILGLHNILSKLSAEIIEKIMLDWIQGDIKSIKQIDSKATYTKIITKENGLIDWRLDAVMIYNRFRAFNPWPGVFTKITIKNQKMILKLIDIALINDGKNNNPGKLYIKGDKLLVATRDKNSIILKRIQLSGKRPISAKEFIAGYSNLIGTKLG